MNKQKNYLDITYWNYKKTIESFDIKNKLEFQKSFYKDFILSKNNPNKNLILKRYFASKYLNFSNEYRIKIMRKY
jgi:predicted transcriptional regulator